MTLRFPQRCAMKDCSGSDCSTHLAETAISKESSFHVRFAGRREDKGPSRASNLSYLIKKTN